MFYAFLGNLVIRSKLHFIHKVFSNDMFYRHNDYTLLFLNLIKQLSFKGIKNSISVHTAPPSPPPTNPSPMCPLLADF